ncbi:acyltransferase family protein [Escherichia coli]|nr:acyltransferase [Escherichia coli]HCN6245253.1 acyltransferase [Escherichia coli]
MSNKIETLDGVRGLALLNVLILHATGLFFPSINSSLSGTAQFGVWLFFVLSAFLLTNRFFVTGFSFSSLLSYFLGRSLRILPVFFLAVYVYYWAGLFNEETLEKIITFSGSYAHFWTIPVEFSFYFILPFIAFAVIWLSERYGALNGVLFLLVLGCVIQYFYPYSNLTLGGKVMWYIPIFLCGMAISCLFMSWKTRKISAITSDVICVVTIISCIAVSPDVIKMLGVSKPFMITNKFVFFSPLLAVMVYLLCYGKGVFGWIMKSKAMTYLGKWSFSIYLWHLLILFRIAPFNHDNIIIYVVAIVSCVGFGAISFYLIEEPCEKLRHKLMASISSFRFIGKQTA